MSDFMSTAEVETLRKRYPVGSTVILLEMKDEKQAPPKGTKGIIEFIDDAGGIHVDWETGCGLALLPECDKFVLVK